MVVTQVVFFTAQRAVGLDREGWPFVVGVCEARRTDVANAATPIARANRVFISSDYGTGGGVVEIKPDNKAQEI